MISVVAQHSAHLSFVICNICIVAKWHILLENCLKNQALWYWYHFGFQQRKLSASVILFLIFLHSVTSTFKCWLCNCFLYSNLFILIVEPGLLELFYNVAGVWFFLIQLLLLLLWILPVNSCVCCRWQCDDDRSRCLTSWSKHSRSADDPSHGLSTTDQLWPHTGGVASTGKGPWQGTEAGLQEHRSRWDIIAADQRD